MFLIQSYHLAYYDEKLFEDTFLTFGTAPMSQGLWSYMTPELHIHALVPEDAIKSFDEELDSDTIEFIEAILDVYGNHPTQVLCEIVQQQYPKSYHQVDSDGKPLHNEISDGYMKWVTKEEIAVQEFREAWRKLHSSELSQI